MRRLVSIDLLGTVLVVGCLIAVRLQRGNRATASTSSRSWNVRFVD